MSAETAMVNHQPAMSLAISDATAAFELLQREGKMLASSQLIPDTYRGKQADCAIIIEVARRIGASPVLVANNLDIIHGRPGWRSQFLIATVNTCGRFSTMRYEYRGAEGTKDRACRAWAIERETGHRLDGTWIDWKMIDAEGWSKKSGSKWLTMPEQMFVYRSAAFWTRAYAPEIAMGMSTRDEIDDMIDVTPPRANSATIASLNDRMMNGAGHASQTIEHDVGNGAGAAVATGQPTPAATSTTATASTAAGNTGGPSDAAIGDQIVNAKSVEALDEALSLLGNRQDGSALDLRKEADLQRIELTK